MPILHGERVRELRICAPLVPLLGGQRGQLWASYSYFVAVDGAIRILNKCS